MNISDTKSIIDTDLNLDSIENSASSYKDKDLFDTDEEREEEFATSNDKQVHPIELGENISLPKELVHCNKLLNHLMQMETKVHPFAAKAAFDTLIGALTARWVYSHTGTSTALYIIVIAKTGSGKNIGLNAIEQILESLNKGEKLVASQITSVGALDDLFKDSPTIVNIIDEFGDVLSNMDSGSQKQLATAMKKVYASSATSQYNFGKYSSNGGKQSKDMNRLIKRPFYSILGLTTSEQFFEAANINMINDGFMNRFIILNGEDVKPIFNGIETQKELPEDILDHIKHLTDNQPATEMLLGSIKPPTYFSDDSPKVIKMTEEAQNYYAYTIGDADLENSDIYQFCSSEEEQNIELSNLRRNISIRWRENSIRYATALAAYEGHQEIELYILQYAYNYVKTLGIQFLNLFKKEVIQTKLQKQMLLAEQWFREQEEKSESSNSKRYTLSTIGQYMYPLKHLKGSERKHILDELVSINVLNLYVSGRTRQYYLAKD